jgi:transcriptional regulator of acetoin/glycerol metabolism
VAAKALGINRTTLYKKAKRLGLDLSSLPAGG